MPWAVLLSWLNAEELVGTCILSSYILSIGWRECKDSHEYCMHLPLQPCGSWGRASHPRDSLSPWWLMQLEEQGSEGFSLQLYLAMLLLAVFLVLILLVMSWNMCTYLCSWISMFVR